MSTDQVILATAGYDHTIKFWAAHTGVCTGTLQHADSQVSLLSDQMACSDWSDVR